MIHLTGPSVCFICGVSCFTLLVHYRHSRLQQAACLSLANILVFAMLIGQPSSQSATNGPSAGLSLNLASNNPFRNRAASPNNLSSPLPRSPFEDPPPRPTSRNPFLDPAFSSSTSQLVTSPEKMAQAQPKGARSQTAEELFVSFGLVCNESHLADMKPPGFFRYQCRWEQDTAIPTKRGATFCQQISSRPSPW
jgi:hypothetical protein